VGHSMKLFSEKVQGRRFVNAEVTFCSFFLWVGNPTIQALGCTMLGFFQNPDTRTSPLHSCVSSFG